MCAISYGHDRIRWWRDGGYFLNDPAKMPNIGYREVLKTLDRVELGKVGCG